MFAFLLLGTIQVCLADRPTCENIGTRSEGWYFRGELIAWDNCAQDVLPQTKKMVLNKSILRPTDDCSSIRECLCVEACESVCRIVNGEQVCERSCETICNEV